MNPIPTDHRPADGALGSFDENRAWQTRLIFERTTVADRFAMVESMLTELGEKRVGDAIERKLAARERTFTPPPADDR